MKFEDNFLYGVKTYHKRFEKYCDSLALLLCPITQCGMVEVHKSGNVFMAANRLDFYKSYLKHQCYLSDPLFTYPSQPSNAINPFDASHGLGFVYNNTSYVGRKLDILHGVYYTEHVNDSVYRHYWFASNNHDLYTTLIRDFYFLSYTIEQFKFDNQSILNELNSHPVNMLKIKGDNYFESPEIDNDKEKMLDTLQATNMLHKGAILSDEEYQCLKDYGPIYQSPEVIDCIPNKVKESLSQKLTFTLRPGYLNGFSQEDNMHNNI